MTSMLTILCWPAAGLVPGAASDRAETCPRPPARQWRRGLAVLALALVPLLSAAPEARPQSLIGNLNIGTPTDAAAGLSADGGIAQAFRTGSNTNGYTLDSIAWFFSGRHFCGNPRA